MDAVSIPAADIAVPAVVRRIAAGASLIPVWRNELGGVTFRTGDGRFIKHGPRNAETTMAGEAERLAWARAYTPVPEVLTLDEDGTHEWLVTRALPGLSAVDPRWIAEPAKAVAAVGAGLRALHDALPVEARSTGRYRHGLRRRRTAASAFRRPFARRRPSTGSWYATAMRAARTRSWATPADGAHTSISVHSASPTGGPISPWPP